MESLQEINALKLAHAFVRSRVREGDLCVDATAGNGGDTALLAKLVGPGGCVHAFDIQRAAIDRTAERLREAGLLERCALHHVGHQSMDAFVQPDSAACIMFNFGYLPGGDHSIGTRADTSIMAIEKALRLVKPGGVLSLCLYYGGVSGFEERDAILEFAGQIDPMRYTVLMHRFINRTGCPPIFLMIERHA